jgi:hypothetical protein
VPPIDIEALARPFAHRTFAGPEDFEHALREEIDRDLAHAAEGNVDSPLKAALDVMRDTRWVLRELVDFSGLTGRSQKEDFLGWYVPRASFLAAGPPMERLQQVLALLDRGLLRIVGPRTRFDGDPANGVYVVSSDQVPGSAVPVTTLVDARIPSPDLRSDLSPLTVKLRESGAWTSYVNHSGGADYDTGGVAVSRSPFHPVSGDGGIDENMYVLGIPTEHTRWFMQVGSSRPGMWSDFVHDADAIAAHALRPVSRVDACRAQTPELVGAGGETADGRSPERKAG